MPEVLVLWGDTLKSVFFEAHETVEEFRDRFFYASFENHLEHPDVFIPRGHLKWKEKLMQPDLLMLNYPLEEDDVIVYYSEASHRVDVLMDLKGSPSLFIFHFDEATTVRDMKRKLMAKLTGSLANLPLERIMLSYEGMVMEEETLALIDFGVKPSSLLRAKEIPEVMKPSLQSELYELKFNGNCKNVLENRFPVENVHITIGVHDSEHPESFVDSLSIACYEVNATENGDPLEILVVGIEALSSGYKVTFLLNGNLHFNAKYRLEIRSKSPKYAPNSNSVNIEFRTRPKYGNIHFSGDKSIFCFTISPLPTNMPIVYSLLHLLRKKLSSLGNEGQNYVDEILREIVGFQIIYETGFATNFFSLCENNGKHECSQPEEYLFESDALQEDLQLEYYKNGFDIFVKVLTRSEEKDSSHQHQLETNAVENINNNVQTADVIEDEHTEPVSSLTIKEILNMEEMVYAISDGLLSLNSSNENTLRNVSPVTVDTAECFASLTPNEDQKEDVDEKPMLPVTPALCEGDSDTTIATYCGVDSADLIQEKEEEINNDEEEEEEEVRSIYDGNDHMTELSSNRQASDGSSLMSGLEFVEDGYLVLMPVDALDHSILEVDDVENADIIVDH